MWAKLIELTFETARTPVDNGKGNLSGSKLLSARETSSPKRLLEQDEAEDSQRLTADEEGAGRVNAYWQWL